MSLINFSIEDSVVTVNGRVIRNWAESDGCVTEEPVNNKITVTQGLGGQAYFSKRPKEGWRVTIRVLPGSSDAAFLMGLYNSTATIMYARYQVSTLDGAVGTDGKIERVNATTRVSASTVSPDEFVIFFNTLTQSKGG